MATTIIDLSSFDGTNGFRLDGVAPDDYSGSSVSSAGDVNGDGFDDLIVGADRADPNGDESGSSYIVFGKASSFDAALDLSSLNGTNGFRLDGLAEDDYSGRSVSGAGDVNSDGFDDMIVGAPWADPNGDWSAGSSYVVFGKASSFDAALDLSSLNGTNGFRLDGESRSSYDGDFSGSSVSNAGDVNGDGFDDLIIGAPNADPNGSGSGSSYVLFGKASDFDATLDLSSLDGSNGFRLDGVVELDFSGTSVSNAGDINGDGFDDVIAGTPASSPNGIDHSGSTYVVFGKDSGFEASLDLSSLNGSNGFRLDGEEFLDFSGSSVSTAGDVNGDGFDDLIIGAPNAGPDGSWSGASYVVFGKNTGFDATLDLSSLDGSNGFRLDGLHETHSWGSSVSNAGDVNGDGFDDLIVSASDADPNSMRNAGSTYVVFGKGSGFDASMDLSNLDSNDGFRLNGVAEFDRSGSSVSGAGDVNGDGFDDLMISAIGTDPDAIHDTGSTYIMFGRSVFTGGNVIQGTPGADILTGTSAADIFNAGDGNDTMNGHGGADVFNAGGGNDTLNGGNGNDILAGSSGTDMMNGGLGNDTYRVENVGDKVNEELNEGIDNVIVENLTFSVLTYTLTENVENLTLTGYEAINGTGNSQDNIITGDDQANQLNGNSGNDTLYGDRGNDTLIGWSGADTMLGESGDDSYFVENVGDVITEKLRQGIDNVSSKITYKLSPNVENLTLTGTAAINGTGNGLANVMIGNNAANQLNGGTGTDTLDGGLGTNKLTGGINNDIFRFTTKGHIDTITDYNVANDTVQLENSTFMALKTTGTLAANQFRVGAQAADANDFIIYNKTAGTLLYDADGNGAAAATQIATIGAGLNMTNADIVVI